MAVFFDSYVDVSPASLGGWVDVDVSANCPAGTSGVVLILENESLSNAYDAGVRMNGSSDTFRDAVHANTQRVFFIGVDENRILDVWRGDANLKFYLAGYFTNDAVFFLNAYEHTPTVTGSWQDLTISEVEANAVGAFFILQGKHLGLGIMKKGSYWDNWTSKVEITGAFIGVDSNKKAEGYKSDTSQHFYVVGYIKQGEADYELDTGTTGFSGPDEYFEFNLAANIADPTRGKAVLLRIDDVGEPDPSKKFAAKVPYGSDDRYRGSWHHVWYVSKMLGNKVWLKTQDVANCEIYTSAYFYKDAVDEQPTVVAVAEITSELNVEEGEVIVLGVVEGEASPEIGEVTGVAVLAGGDWQTYLEVVGLIVIGIIKSMYVTNAPPVVKGRSPQPGETYVGRNKRVGFYLCGGLDDGVDITSVKVNINGVEYVSTSPEFHYEGVQEQYLIEVEHPTWGYESAVNVLIDAKSSTNVQMTQVAYSFTTEWLDSKTRGGDALIELYPEADYARDILTIQEDWVRQGVDRYTATLELWYGRYQKLPFIENMEMRVIAGTTNSKGKEVLENGYLSIKIGDGAFVPMYDDTVIDIGPMFAHTNKKVYFKLLVPDGAQTTMYMTLQLAFELQMFCPWGRFAWGVPIYASGGNSIRVHPSKYLYRAYVLTAAMWNALQAHGFIASPIYHGEDKQW